MTDKTLAQRMALVSAEAKYVKKASDVSTGGSGTYKAATHDDVTAVVQPLLEQHGILVSPTTKKHKVKTVGDPDRPSFFTTVLLSVQFTNIDSPDDCMTSEWYGYGIDRGDKGIGKAYSYALKYCYLKTFGIETGEDDEQRVDIEDRGVAEARAYLEMVREHWGTLHSMKELLWDNPSKAMQLRREDITDHVWGLLWKAPTKGYGSVWSTEEREKLRSAAREIDADEKTPDERADHPKMQ